MCSPNMTPSHVQYIYTAITTKKWIRLTKKTVQYSWLNFKLKTVSKNTSYFNLFLK